MSLTVDFDVPTRRRNFAKAIRAANDPGVREFARIIHAARLLHKRVLKWLIENDGEDADTATRRNLVIATAEPDSGEDNTWRLVHNFNALEWTLESAVAQLDGSLFQHVMPEAFGRPFPAPQPKFVSRVAAVA